MTPSGPRWTGKVELIESKLQEPLHWKKPQRVFVNSMSDLFHENLPARDMDAVFAVMSQSPQHTFQVLTKRPRIMLEYMRAERTPDGIDEAGQRFGCHANIEGRWPLPNVWLGVSVEDQPTADARIPLLLQTPAAVRFVSYEPALGPVDFDTLPAVPRGQFSGLAGIAGSTPGIDWLICGGESGPGARPFDLAWARSARDQCKAAGVAFFLKQVGSHPIVHCRKEWDTPTFGTFAIASINEPQIFPARIVKLRSKKGGDPSEWPLDLQNCREFPPARLRREATDQFQPGHSPDSPDTPASTRCNESIAGVAGHRSSHPLKTE